MKTTMIFIIVIIAMVSESNGNVIFEMFAKTDKIAILSEECRSSLRMYVDNMKNSADDNMWALKMWDASSKVPVGLISYNFGELGNFDQCIETKSVSDNIMGKYCLGNFFVTNNSHHIISENDTAYQQSQINWTKLMSDLANGVSQVTYTTKAICIPSNCSDGDVLNILRETQVGGIDFRYVRCQTIEDVDPQWTTGAIYSIIILSLIVIMMILSSCYDIYCRSKGVDPAHLALIAFSVYTNGKKLFTMKTSHEELSVLYGMKFISVMWVVAEHTRYEYYSGYNFNSKYAIELKHSFFTTFLQSAGCAVCTFLMVGGVLVSYVFFKQKRNKGKFNIFRHYFHRYIRIAPPIAGLLLVYANLLRYMGSGPKWEKLMDDDERPCQKNWWSTLLFIQNYVNIREMCLSITWYLNVDMQLFMISPLILLLLNKRPKTAIALLVLGSLASIFAAFWIAFDEQLPANVFGDKPIEFFIKYFYDFYFTTHCSAAPWFMGTILGYLLTRDTAKSVKIPKVASALAWMSSFVVMTICVFGGSTIFRNSQGIGDAFFLAFQKPAWSICIGWIIWACATNRGGVINSMLSYPIFHFLNQFTFSIYILHKMVLSLLVYSQRVSFYYTIVNVIYSFCGILTFTFGLSIIWILAFERPMLVIEKIIFKNK